MDYYNNHPKETYVADEEIAWEMAHRLSGYVNEAIRTRDYRNEHLKDPNGYHPIDEDFVKKFMPLLNLKEYFGEDFTLPAVKPNSELAVLMDLNIIDLLEQGSADAEETKDECEILIADILAGEWGWSEEETRRYADCSLKTWSETSLINRWRKLEYHAKEHDYIKGVPNYFRVHGENALNNRPEIQEVKPMVNIANFLGHQLIESDKDVEVGFSLARQKLNLGWQALRRFVETTTEKVGEMSEAAQSLLAPEAA